MNNVCVNGKIIPAGNPAIMPDNRGYRYGDGLFETMKVFNGAILLEQLHFDRLFNGLRLLQFDIPVLFTPAFLQDSILKLCRKNNCLDRARVRLSVSRGDGGLYDETGELQYIIEAWPLSPTINQLNANGLDIGIFPDAQKSCDRFSSLKSANYLPYVMAAKYAKAHQLNDCLIYNTKGHIADATIANLFLLKNDLLITPSLAEGCVDGVMRKYLLEKLRASGNFEVREGVVTANDLATFDEVFLTNAVHGIKWVKSCGSNRYTNSRVVQLFNDHIAPFYK